MASGNAVAQPSGASNDGHSRYPSEIRRVVRPTQHVGAAITKAVGTLLGSFCLNIKDVAQMFDHALLTAHKLGANSETA